MVILSKLYRFFYSVPVIRAIPSDPEWEHCFGNNSANHPGHPSDWRNLHVLYKVSTQSDIESLINLHKFIQSLWCSVCLCSHQSTIMNKLDFLTNSICRLEWKPLFWKSLSHTHSYSPITVESDFNNPLYEAGVSRMFFHFEPIFCCLSFHYKYFVISES